MEEIKKVNIRSFVNETKLFNDLCIEIYVNDWPLLCSYKVPGPTFRNHALAYMLRELANKIEEGPPYET